MHLSEYGKANLLCLNQQPQVIKLENDYHDGKGCIPGELAFPVFGWPIYETNKVTK